MSATNRLTVRAFDQNDVPELLELMKGLARFEGYIDNFAVTDQDLVDHGLGENPAFESFVAEQGGETGLLGMVVLYRIPWTYDLKPTVIMKELFVRDDARGLGVGRALLQRAAARALELGAPRLQWTVLDSNEAAKRFYHAAGSKHDTVWEPWGLDESAMKRLIES